jgi:cobalt-precorrin 5A hydrolase
LLLLDYFFSKLNVIAFINNNFSFQICFISLNIPFNTFDKDQLNRVDHLLSTRSDYVFQTVGVYGVAESAALYALINGVNESQQSSNNEPELVQSKIKTPKATCAIARRYLDSRTTTQEII